MNKTSAHAHELVQLASRKMEEACKLLFALTILQLGSFVLPQNQHISSEPSGQTGFVIGRVDSCETPTTTYCDEVSYAVPSSIAWLTEVIEYEIRNKVEPEDAEGDLNLECKDVLKETFCKKKFPRCSPGENRVFFETSENCTHRLQENCGRRGESLIRAGLCNVVDAELRSETCLPLSEHGQVQLQHCNLMERDTLVSDWMYQYIVQVSGGSRGVSFGS